MVRAARAAAMLLTRIPVGGHPFSRQEWTWAAAWFPLVGAVIGAIMALVWRVTVGLGPLPAAVLTIAGGVALTGALHEDGLADTADALGGASDRTRVFTILKDSRLGTYGVVALVLVLSLRIALVAQLAPIATVALISAQCTSRWPPAWLLAALPYVTPEREAKSRAVARAGPAQAMLATLWTLLVLLVAVATAHLSVRAAILVAATVCVAGAWCGYRFKARTGGITGDFLGAAQQVCECAALLALAAARRAGW